MFGRLKKSHLWQTETLPYLGKAAIYDYNETDTNVKLLYVRESVIPSSPNYINLFTEFSAFHLGGGLHAVVDNGLVTESFMGGNVAGYDEFGTALPVVAFGNGTIYGYSFTAGDPEKALTTDTLRLEMVLSRERRVCWRSGWLGLWGWRCGASVVRAGNYENASVFFPRFELGRFARQSRSVGLQVHLAH